MVSESHQLLVSTMCCTDGPMTKLILRTTHNDHMADHMSDPWDWSHDWPHDFDQNASLELWCQGSFALLPCSELCVCCGWLCYVANIYVLSFAFFVCHFVSFVAASFFGLVCFCVCAGRLYHASITHLGAAFDRWPCVKPSSGKSGAQLFVRCQIFFALIT